MPQIKPKHAPRDVTPNPVSANAFGQIRSRLAQAGYSNAWIRNQIGNAVGGRDKSQIIAALEAAMKTDEAKAKKREKVAAEREKVRPVKEQPVRGKAK